MKRFTVITALFSVGTLAVWAISQTLVPTPTKGGDSPDNLHNAASNMKVAPVFDTTGAVVSDPSGTLLNANQSGGMAIPVTGADIKVAPVFDTTGAVVSDPSGTMLNANQSGDLAIQVTGTDIKVAPVFDATGAVLSNPSGIILNAVNP